MNKTKIEWCDSTWNPVTGCLHGCGYCYARGITKRFSYEGKTLDAPSELQRIWINDSKGSGAGNRVLRYPVNLLDDGRKVPYPFGFEPTFHKYRLNDYIGKKGRNIFVCSMADLFGSWVPDEWIEEVFAACERAPQHRYLFLTKNHQRYLDLAAVGKLPSNDNMWYGTTVTSPDTMFFFSEAHHTFISIEPMTKRIFADTPIKKLAEWIIIGAMTGPGSFRHQPKREWIEEAVYWADNAGVPVFMKDSLIPIVSEENMRREFPWKEM